MRPPTQKGYLSTQIKTAKGSHRGVARSIRPSWSKSRPAMECLYFLVVIFADHIEGLARIDRY